jgi:hypothetical protein
MVENIYKKHILKQRIIFIFYFIIVLILFFSMFNLYTMDKFSKSSEINKLGGEVIHNLEESITNLLMLVDTEDLDSYKKFKSKIKSLININRALDMKIRPSIEVLDLGSNFNFDESFEKFIEIKDVVIDTHSDVIKNQLLLAQKSEDEKLLRYVFADLALEIKDVEFTYLVWNMRYLSKEGLYQYKNKEYLDDWLLKIDDIGIFINYSSLENKDILLSDLKDYKIIANEMSSIVLELEEQKLKSKQNIIILIERMDLTDSDIDIISEAMIIYEQKLYRNSFIITLIITLVGISSILISKKFFFKL